MIAERFTACMMILSSFIILLAFIDLEVQDMKITPDIIVSAGLVVALILSIVLGGDVTLQTNIAAGLTGFIGRTVMDKTSIGGVMK